MKITQANKSKIRSIKMTLGVLFMKNKNKYISNGYGVCDFTGEGV